MIDAPVRSTWKFPNTTETEPGWLSPSQVTEYLSCPSCYELGRIQHLPRPLGVNLPIGSAIHKAVEMARLDKTGKVALLSIKDVAAEHFDAECSR
jgi:hypothetical protein